jgi:hypothetical protein
MEGVCDQFGVCVGGSSEMSTTLAMGTSTATAA